MQPKNLHQPQAKVFIIYTQHHKDTNRVAFENKKGKRLTITTDFNKHPFFCCVAVFFTNIEFILQTHSRIHPTRSNP